MPGMIDVVKEALPRAVRGLVALVFVVLAGGCAVDSGKEETASTEDELGNGDGDGVAVSDPAAAGLVVPVAQRTADRLRHLRNALVSRQHLPTMDNCSLAMMVAVLHLADPAGDRNLANTKISGGSYPNGAMEPGLDSSTFYGDDPKDAGPCFWSLPLMTRMFADPAIQARLSPESKERLNTTLLNLVYLRSRRRSPERASHGRYPSSSKQRTSGVV